VVFTRSLYALAVSVALSAVPAHAATMDLFTFTSPQITGPLTVTLPASPVPTSFVTGTSFTISATASFEGNTFTGPVTFLNAGGASGGGSTFTGPVLFSGTDASPTFNLGSFNLSGSADLGNIGGVQPVTGTLVISQIAGVTPEPAPFALLATGILGLVGFAGHRKLLHSQSRC